MSNEDGPLLNAIARAIECMDCEETGQAVIRWSAAGSPTFGPCPHCSEVVERLASLGYEVRR